MNILAFDLGASGGKLFLARLTNEQTTIEEIHRFDNHPCQINNSLYWDIIHIYEEMNRGIRKAINLTNDSIDSFSIDSYCNDFALVDETGSLLTPVRCYRDPRQSRFQEKIYQKISPKKFYELSGNQNALFNTSMQLASMNEEHLDYLFRESNTLLFVPDLLGFFLTGKAVTEYTLASTSQLYSYKDKTWCKEILEAFHIPKTLFAPIVPPGNILGSTQSSYNHIQGTKGFTVVNVCEHDTASAYLSSSLSGDKVLISSGTWALIGAETDHPIINNKTYRYNFANEGSCPNHHRLLRNVMGSWLIQEVKRDYESLGQPYTYSQLDAMAWKAPPFQYIIDVDDHLFYAPGHMTEKIKFYCQNKYQRTPQSLGEVIRCIYESLAMKFRWTIEGLEEVIGHPLPVINFMGGGSKSQILCQFTANACNRTVVSGPEEATALGNIAMQLVAAGKCKTIEDAGKLLETTYKTTTYTPQMKESWESVYQEYKKGLDLNYE